MKIKINHYFKNTLYLISYCMLEFELLIKEIEYLYAKEKSILKKIHLETALKSLIEYERLSQD